MAGRSGPASRPPRGGAYSSVPRIRPLLDKRVSIPADGVIRIASLEERHQCKAGRRHERRRSTAITTNARHIRVPATSPRRRRSPSGLPAPPAIATETAGTAFGQERSRQTPRREIAETERPPGSSASGIHQRRSAGRFSRHQQTPARQSATATMVTAIPETRINSISCSSSCGSAWRANSQLFSISSPGSSTACRIATQRCSHAAGTRKKAERPEPEMPPQPRREAPEPTTAPSPLRPAPPRRADS